MNPRDAQLAARQGSQSATAPAAAVATATGLAKCSPRFVLSAVKTPKFRLNPAKADQCTAAIATTRTNQPGNTGFSFVVH